MTDCATTESYYIALIGMLLFFVACLVLAILFRGTENYNEELQKENSDLIERNQKLDTYLEEARAEAVKANHKLMKLEYTENVYLMLHKDSFLVCGCFRSKEDADRNLNGSADYFIREHQILD